MVKESITFKADEELAEEIEKRADAAGVSRSEYMRTLSDQGLEYEVLESMNDRLANTLLEGIDYAADLEAENQELREQLEQSESKAADLEAEIEALEDEVERLEAELEDKIEGIHEQWEQEIKRLEAERDDLRRQLQAVNSRQEDITELATYVKEERSYRDAGLPTRMKWWLFGRGGE